MFTSAHPPLLVEPGLRTPTKTKETFADKDMTTFSRNLDWNLLKTFYEIIQSGGISRASRTLCRKQPAVSLALKRLEAQLDVRLCGRGPSGFCLTDEGVLVGEICVAISELVQRMPRKLAHLNEEVAGRISIQVVSGLVCETLDRGIARFHENHPNAEIIIDISTWETVVAALLRDEIDIGIAPASTLRTDLHYEFLFEEMYRPYVGLGHSLYGKTFYDPDALADEAFILTGADEPDALTDFRTQHGLGRNVAGISEHLDGAMRLTSLGVGICFLPEGYADPHVLSGRLWPLLPNFGRPSMPVFIITNPRASRKLARQLLLVECCSAMDHQCSQ
jgi:DNA-binding transcriptional LysR family regulator